MTDQYSKNLAKPVISRLSGVLDIVHEKLTSLKQKEKKIIEMAQIRKRKAVDPTVKEELEAMAYAEPSFLMNLKPMPMRPEKPIKRKKEPAIVPQNPFHKQSAKTAEEKYRILDARDKLFQSSK